MDQGRCSGPRWVALVPHHYLGGGNLVSTRAISVAWPQTAQWGHEQGLRWGRKQVPAMPQPLGAEGGGEEEDGTQAYAGSTGYHSRRKSGATGSGAREKESRGALSLTTGESLRLPAAGVGVGSGG